MRWFFICFCISLLSCDKKKSNPPGLFLSFDDRSIAEWKAIDSLFQGVDFKATFYITQFDSLSELEVETLRRMELSGHEIGFHGLRHLHAQSYIKEHGYTKYLDTEIDSGLVLMEKENLFPQTFAYPYGEDFWFTDLFLLKRFQSVRRVVSLKKRSSLDQIPEIFYDFDNDRTLKALGIDANSKIDKDMLTEGLDLAVRQNSVLMLYAHRPSPAPSSYEVSIELLDYLVAETHKRGMKFYRAKDLYQ